MKNPQDHPDTHDKLALEFFEISGRLRTCGRAGPRGI